MNNDILSISQLDVLAGRIIKNGFALRNAVYRSFFLPTTLYNQILMILTHFELSSTSFISVY